MERRGSDDGATNTHDYIWLSPDPDPILTSVAGPCAPSSQSVVPTLESPLQKRKLK